MIPIVAACIWVIAATVVALLPMRLQYAPGLMLLILAPILIAWLSISVGWWVGLLALAGFLSMFRNPLRYFWAKARGRAPELPK